MILISIYLVFVFILINYLLKAWIHPLHLLFTQLVIPNKRRPDLFLHQRLCTCHQKITLRELERTIATDRQGKDETRCSRVFARVLVVFVAKAGAGGDRGRGRGRGVRELVFGAGAADGDRGTPRPSAARRTRVTRSAPLAGEDYPQQHNWM